MTLDDVLGIFRALEEHNVEYALFGGLAMAAHGLDRGTRDLDIFVRAESKNVARLRGALHSIFDDPTIEELTYEDLAGEYPAIQYGPPEVDYTIDIVTRLGTAFTFNDLQVQRVMSGAVPVMVVTPRTLYEMKRDTLRPRDRADAERLRETFGLGGE